MPSAYLYKKYLDDCRAQGITPKSPRGTYMSKASIQAAHMTIQLMMGFGVIVLMGVLVYIVM